MSSNPPHANFALQDNNKPVSLDGWSKHLCGCLDNPSNCCMAWCCPCFSLGRSMHRLGLKEYNTVVAIVLGIIVLQMIVSAIVPGAGSGIMWLALGVYLFVCRSEVRKALRIPGSSCEDLVCSGIMWLALGVYLFVCR